VQKMIDWLLQTYAQLEAYFGTLASQLVAAYGPFGVLIGMFLESSIVPIPSEAILITAGFFFDPVTVAVYGTIGSTLGAMVGYFIGLKGGRPVIDWIGPYLFITQERVLNAEKKFAKYGYLTVLGSRLVPFIPFKVFSITSGILKFPFYTFVIFTFIGTIPRAFILAWIGSQIVNYKTEFFIALGVLLVLGVAYWMCRKRKRQP